MKDTSSAGSAARIEVAERCGIDEHYGIGAHHGNEEHHGNEGHPGTGQTARPWSARFAQFRLADAQRLGEIEHENAKLKRLLAVRDLEMELIRDAARKRSAPSS